MLHPNPIGTILTYAGEVIPNGWLLCDGRELEIIKYQDLFNVIKNRFGGDGVNAFKLPKFQSQYYCVGFDGEITYENAILSSIVRIIKY